MGDINHSAVVIGLFMAYFSALQKKKRRKGKIVCSQAKKYPQNNEEVQMGKGRLYCTEREWKAPQKQALARILNLVLVVYCREDFGQYICAINNHPE